MKLLFSRIYIFILTGLCISCGGAPQLPPDPGSITEPDLSAPTIKVYVENSGSMNGYVKGATDFENAVYSYLSDLQLASIGVRADSSFKNVMELNYINSVILQQTSDIKEFIDKLEPSTFKQVGGNLGTSDISDIIGMILEKLNNDEIAVLVSDCIFSPGKRYKAKDNADDYLVAQQIGIKNHIAKEMIENPNLSFVVMRLLSQFDGKYYNKFDDSVIIKDTRPFYIWLIGDSRYLKKVMSLVDYHKIKGSGVQNIYAVSSFVRDINYSILSQPRIGKFSPDKKSPKVSIINAKTENKGGGNMFQLSIGVDFSKLLLEDEYLLDSNNYEISNKSYSLEISKNLNTSSTYTHIIKLILNQPIISKGTVKISLLNKMPQWIDDFNDADGLDIHAAGAMGKTYGLKHLVEGVFDAYAISDNYATITININ